MQLDFQANSPRRPYFCRVRSSVAQQVANNTNEYWEYDTIDFDPHGMANLGHPTYLLIPVAGVWVMSACMAWSVNGTGVRQTYIQKSIDGGAVFNGIVGQAEEGVQGSIHNQGPSVAVVDWLPAGARIADIVFQNSGGNLNLNAGSWTQNFMAALIAEGS